MRNVIIEPNYFEKGNRAVTIDFGQYVSMLQIFFAPAFKEFEEYLISTGRNHGSISTSVNAGIERNVSGRFIYKRSNILWPQHDFLL